jgi:HopA1 effector protein family
MSRYREQVEAALRAVTIRGPTQYVWLDRRSRRLPASVEAALDDGQRRRYLVLCLREELYFSFYCHGRPVAARWGGPQPVSGDPWLLDAMSRANTGRGGWDPGWSVERVDGAEAVVADPRLRVRVAVDDCDGGVRPGALVNVRRPTELAAVAPGFWTVLGDASDPASGDGDVRVYWNVTLAGAATLVGALTSRLNEAGAPFRLKLADHALRLDRCDAAVLYLDGDVFRGSRSALATVADELATRLRPEIPAFTLELAPGVGLAEDHEGESFGVRRCAPLADAIVRAHEQGVTGLDERVDAVAARFAEDGIVFDAPYLDPSLEGHHVL